jgi:hypothetical protein
MCETEAMERAASQFLRTLRAHRSQVQWSRRLGYRGNPVTDWERGARFPTALEALRAAALAGVDVPAAFARFAPNVPLERHNDELALADWLSALRGATSVKELAQRSGHSRFRIARWLAGDAKPRLPDFFRLLDAITGRLPEWVAELVDIAGVPDLVGRHEAANAARRLAFEVPWTEAILRLLDTTAYRRLRRHRSSFLAHALGIADDEVDACLGRLLVADVIEKRGARYVPKSQGVVDTQGGKQALNALRAHWSRVAAARLNAPLAQDFFAYNVISLSASDLDVVREKLRATFREIRSLVAASQPEEVAAVINLQIVTFLPEPPGGDVIRAHD